MPGCSFRSAVACASRLKGAPVTMTWRMPCWRISRPARCSKGRFHKIVLSRQLPRVSRGSSRCHRRYITLSVMRVSGRFTRTVGYRWGRGWWMMPGCMPSAVQRESRRPVVPALRITCTGWPLRASSFANFAQRRPPMPRTGGKPWQISRIGSCGMIRSVGIVKNFVEQPISEVSQVVGDVICLLFDLNATFPADDPRQFHLQFLHADRCAHSPFRDGPAHHTRCSYMQDRAAHEEELIEFGDHDVLLAFRQKDEGEVGLGNAR